MPTGGDTVTQLRYLYNWLVQNNVPNPLGAGASGYSRSAASGILGGSAEKAPNSYGYAAALKVLLNAADIPNAIIGGSAWRQSTQLAGEQHAWNYVQLDSGSWFAIDTAWDAQEFAGGPASFSCFLVGSTSVTEPSLSGKTQFSQNHVAEASYDLPYPTLSQTASDSLVSTGFELISGGSSTRYGSLEEALAAAESGDIVKLWEPAVLEDTLTIPNGVTLDLNGQGSGTSAAISGGISPLLSVAEGSSVCIINSGAFASVSTTMAGACIQNGGTLYLGSVIELACGEGASGPVEGGSTQYAPSAYVSGGDTALSVFLVVKPTNTAASQAYEADDVEMVQDMLGGITLIVPAFRYCKADGALADVPAGSIPACTWQVRSPGGGGAAGSDPLENGDYRLSASLFGYPFSLTVSVSGVPDLYTVTVDGGGDGASGGGEYEPGAQVTVSAGVREGYTFAGWTAEGIVLADAGQAQLSFGMPANDVSLSASWTADEPDEPDEPDDQMNPTSPTCLSSLSSLSTPSIPTPARLRL